MPSWQEMRWSDPSTLSSQRVDLRPPGTSSRPCSWSIPSSKFRWKSPSWKLVSTRSLKKCDGLFACSCSLTCWLGRMRHELARLVQFVCRHCLLHRHFGGLSYWLHCKNQWRRHLTGDCSSLSNAMKNASRKCLCSFSLQGFVLGIPAYPGIVNSRYHILIRACWIHDSGRPLLNCRSLSAGLVFCGPYFFNPVGTLRLRCNR